MELDLERLPDDLRPEAVKLGRRALQRMISVVYQAELSGFSHDRLRPLFEEIGLSDALSNWIIQASTEHYQGRRRLHQEDHFRELLQKSLQRSSWVDLIAKGLLRLGLLIVGLLPAWSGGLDRVAPNMWEARFLDSILQTLGSFLAAGAALSLLFWVSEVRGMLREARERKKYLDTL